MHVSDPIAILDLPGFRVPGFKDVEFCTEKRIATKMKRLLILNLKE